MYWERFDPSTRAPWHTHTAQRTPRSPHAPRVNSCTPKLASPLNSPNNLPTPTIPRGLPPHRTRPRRARRTDHAAIVRVAAPAAPMRRGNFDSAHEDGDGASVTSGGSSKRSWSVNRPSAIERMRDPPTSPPHARGGGQAPISESGRTDSSTGSWMRRGQFAPRLPALIGTPPIYNPIVPSPRDRIPAPRLTRPFSLDSPSRRHHRQGTHRGHRRHVRARLTRAPAARFRQLHATPAVPVASRFRPIPTR